MYMVVYIYMVVQFGFSVNNLLRVSYTHGLTQSNAAVCNE